MSPATAATKERGSMTQVCGGRSHGPDHAGCSRLQEEDEEEYQDAAEEEHMRRMMTMGMMVQEGEHEKQSVKDDANT